jgi:hypothetical protein
MRHKLAKSTENKISLRELLSGRQLARELDTAWLQSLTAPYREVVRNLKKIEVNYIDRLKDHPELALEVRRRIAEFQLDLALRRGSSISVCQRVLNRNSELGWSNFSQKFHFHLMYARGMFARGHIRAARKFASALVSELNEELEKLRKQSRQTGRKWMLQSLGLAQEVLEKASSSGGRETKI